MLDEDYFEKGVCHWTFTSATVVLKATGAPAAWMSDDTQQWKATGFRK